VSRTRGAPAATWTAVSASVRGPSHDRNGMPNQDAVRTLAVDGRTVGLVAAVADGHGGNRYVRSATGSSIAVDVACEAGGALLTELGTSPDTKAIHQALTSRLAPGIILRWRERVQQDHQLHPFTDEEHTRGGANLNTDPFISYGCTLILSIMAPTWMGLLQIGDGDAILIDAGGAVTAPIPTDDRLVGGETTSLCLPDAANDARVAVIRSPLPSLMVLASDGYGNSFASERWREESATGFLEAVARDGLDNVAVKLPGWLTDSAGASGDDVTMVLAVRAGVAAPPTKLPVPNVSAPLPAASETRTPRRRLLVGILAALVVGLGAGGAGGWFAYKASNSTKSAPGTTTSAAPTTLPPTTIGQKTPQPTEALPRRVSITGTGKVITFIPDPKGKLEAQVTGESVAFAPVASIQKTGCEVNVSLVLSGKTVVPPKTALKIANKSIDLDRPAGSLLCDHKLVWVLSTDGEHLRAYQLGDGKATIDWQPVEPFKN